MVDYTLTGITQTNDFNVYTGATPFSLVFYAKYKASTTSVTITDVPFNSKLYIVIEDIITKQRTSKYVVIESAYCGNICDGVFTLTVTYPPDPTPTVTPTISPTISLTPSITVSPSPSSTEKIQLSVTPTITPTKTIAVTPTKTPTLTPTPQPTLTCGYYEVYYSVPLGDEYYSSYSMIFYYSDCYLNREMGQTVNNNSSVFVCVKEIDGVPQITLPVGVEQYTTINRQSNCGNIY